MSNAKILYEAKLENEACWLEFQSHDAVSSQTILILPSGSVCHHIHFKSFENVPKSKHHTIGEHLEYMRENLTKAGFELIQRVMYGKDKNGDNCEVSIKSESHRSAETWSKKIPGTMATIEFNFFHQTESPKWREE